MKNVVLKENKYGQKIWVDENEEIGRTIIAKGIYDEHAIYCIEKILQSLDSPVCLDIGANIGFFSLLAAKCVGASGKVIAFEPNPSTADILEKNIALNGFKNILIASILRGKETS